MVKTRREERLGFGRFSAQLVPCVFAACASCCSRSKKNERLFTVYFIMVSPILPTSSPFLIFLSADEDVTLAGFKEKFKTYVIVDSSGVNMWMSPASFKSSCDMVIRFYPFDRQTCHLTFGSLTFDNRLLKMMNKDDSHSTSGWTEKKLVLILMYR